MMVLENPFLDMEIRENKLDLEILNTQRNIASINYQDLGMVKVKEKQILSIRKKLNENIRKQKLLNLKAPISGVFILADIHLKPGKWIKKGEFLGEVTNPEKTVIFAYIEEKDISKVRLNDKALVTLSGEVDGFYGKVISLSLVPSDNWRNSPLLSVSGGPIEVLSAKPDGKLDILHNYYRVTIIPDSTTILPENLTGKVKIRKNSSIAGNFLRFALSLFQREFSF